MILYTTYVDGFTGVKEPVLSARAMRHCPTAAFLCSTSPYHLGCAGTSLSVCVHMSVCVCVCVVYVFVYKDTFACVCLSVYACECVYVCVRLCVCERVCLSVSVCVEGGEGFRPEVDGFSMH